MDPIGVVWSPFWATWANDCFESSSRIFGVGPGSSRRVIGGIGGTEDSGRKGGIKERVIGCEGGGGGEDKEQEKKGILEVARHFTASSVMALGSNFDARAQASKERQISSSRLRFLEELSGLRRPGVGHPTSPVGVYSSANAIAASLPIDDICWTKKN